MYFENEEVRASSIRFSILFNDDKKHVICLMGLLTFAI